MILIYGHEVLNFSKEEKFYYFLRRVSSANDETIQILVKGSKKTFDVISHAFFNDQKMYLFAIYRESNSKNLFVKIEKFYYLCITFQV